MRVALLSTNAQLHNAIGNQVAEKVRFFQERGAEVRVFVQDARRLHPDLHAVAVAVLQPVALGPAWDYLRQADLVVAVYAQACALWQYLPMLAGLGPRILFDYHGVTPPELWHDQQQREGLQASQRERGYVWFADHAMTTSQFTFDELRRATRYPIERMTTLPLPIDIERFHPEPGERFLHAKLGIEGRILLYVGRVASNKRVPLLIEALAALGDARLHAVIVGDTSDVYAAEVERCRAIAQQLGVADRVHFVGQLDDTDLPRVYRSADVLVMPSLHEGFCVPVLEAMACGVPVIASRSAALPETIGCAGLTFAPNDAEDLARQVKRILASAKLAAHGGAASPPASLREEEGRNARRIAIVSFRFGPDIVGGAETSLRVMAGALRDAGHDLRVFTTCTKSESGWRNELPAGLVTLDGVQVERFPIDPHDPVAHGKTVRAILDADGEVDPDVERRYHELSIHSAALMNALREREAEFDAILVGPYLFGLTADVVAEFPRKTLLVPCFHDEALARLAQWPRLYGTVGGLLFHSPEEQQYAERVLGVNHPNTHEIGAFLAIESGPSKSASRRPSVVSCGRYSTQKNVPLLLEWARRYQTEQPGQIEFIFMGQGDVALPAEPWLRDLGRVEPNIKRAVLSGARALVQLSANESLSLVALEAWAEKTPVIVHRDCAVLRGQIERSKGGACVADYASFAATLDDLLANEAAWQARGERGHAYVAARYGCAQKYSQTLLQAIDALRKPIAEQMRDRGIQRAGEWSRPRWQERFADLVDGILSEPPRQILERIIVDPLRASCHSSVGTGTLLLPLRLRNEGTHAAAPHGPARTVIACEIVDAATDEIDGARQTCNLSALLLPGETQTHALPIALPKNAGMYRIRLWCERFGATTRAEPAEVSLQIGKRTEARPATCASTFLDTVQQTLPSTQQLQQLPCDYVDVTEGTLAPVKRWIKRKLLYNFKHAYVDGLSRQQSQVNGQVVVMIQQLAECCAMLDNAVQGLHRRLDGLEGKIERLAGDNATPAPKEEILG